MISKQFKLFALCILSANLLTANHLYEQLIPKVSQNINPENPTIDEVHFLNACRAHSQAGTKFETIGTENWQAINSIDMFKFILPTYARTLSNFGYIAMARQCTQMTDDTEILNNRVALTQFLHQNSDLFDRLNHIIAHATTSEKTFTELFRQISEEEKEAVKATEQKLYFSRLGLDRLNENSYALGSMPRINQSASIGMIVIPQLLASGAYKNIKNGTELWNLSGKEEDLSPEEHKRLEELNTIKDTRLKLIAEKNYSKLASDIFIKDGITNLPKTYYDFATKLVPFAAHHIKENTFYHWIKNELFVKDAKFDPNSYKTTAAASLYTTFLVAIYAFWPTCYGYVTYQQCKYTKEVLDLIYERQQELISVAHLVKSMKLIHKAIQSDATLQHLMSSEAAKLTELFDPNNKNTSSDLKALIKALSSTSFQGDDSYWLSQQGKILATHHLLVRIKDQLVPYLETFGQIDAYLAVAKLYEEFKHHPNVTFCLPGFIHAETPHLDAQAYWHPLIDANKVVTNSLAMNQNDAANLIITGPNAGGKTTSLMSLIINVIFAQSFGIAPSASLTLTPFAKIHSYLDITTNLQEGLSLFAAEVDRAKKLKTSIMSCKPGQKTFTIIDEIFSGTDPKVASEVGFNFAQQLGDMKHSMTIITTHFPALTGLEETTHRYVNFKVADATIHEDGSITYPFKLVPGISSQNIAAQMLSNQGII